MCKNKKQLDIYTIGFPIILGNVLNMFLKRLLQDNAPAHKELTCIIF